MSRWCPQDGRLTLTDAFIDDRYAYILELGWNGEPTGVRQVRAAVFSLIGSFAESATYVRQCAMQCDPDSSDVSLRFEVGIGDLASDAGFHPHGHAVVINVIGVA